MSMRFTLLLGAVLVLVLAIALLPSLTATSASVVAKKMTTPLPALSASTSDVMLAAASAKSAASLTTNSAEVAITLTAVDVFGEAVVAKVQAPIAAVVVISLTGNEVIAKKADVDAGGSVNPVLKTAFMAAHASFARALPLIA